MSNCLLITKKPDQPITCRSCIIISCFARSKRSETLTSQQWWWRWRGIWAEQRGDQIGKRNAALKWIRNTSIQSRNRREADDRVKRIEQTQQEESAPSVWPIHSCNWDVWTPCAHSPGCRCSSWSVTCFLAMSSPQLPVWLKSPRYWGEPDRRGSGRGGGGGLLMLPKRLSFPLYRITPSLSWSSRHSLSSLNSPSLLSAAARRKSAGAFGSFRKFLMCTTVSIHVSDEWTTQKRQSEEGSKQPDSVCCECIIWAAELPCASVCASFCRRESGLGPGWSAGS